MVIKKKKGTFNDYDVSVSYGQLEAIMASLERDHADPVSDEMFSEIQWYMQRVPGPGEEEEDQKAREEGAVETGAATPGDVEGEDVPIPMPPTEGGVDGEEPSTPPGASVEGGEEGELPPPEGMEGGPEGGPEGGDQEGFHKAPTEGEDLDALPAPPAG